ncbi:hypothetical protein EC968_000831 [Mortierella alpina]|nr:hypothetical protein EC968_000831 [Mortierella alpina]
MKRSRLEFADPFTSERVHTEGEKFFRQRTRVTSHADPSSQHLHGEVTAAQVYLSKDFHIGNSVLRNRSYPTSRHVDSLITIAAFCARASALRRRPRTEGASIGLVSPTASALSMASASIAGSKWLAKLGQIMFGGVCAQAGHTHHRRTRASLELLKQQNIELGQKILAEEQQQSGQQKGQWQTTATAAESTLPSPASPAEEVKPSEEDLQFSSSISLHSSGPGSLLHSSSTSALSLSVVSTGTTNLGATTTNTSTSTSTPLNDKWCRHCSRAMSCLVIIAVQESNGALAVVEDLGASLEDVGFVSSAMDTLNVIQSLSSSTSSLNDSPVDRRSRADLASDLSRRKHDASPSPYILFSRSHDPDDDLIRSSTVPAVTVSSALSESLADAFGSELASARSSDKHSTRGNISSSGSSGRSSNNERIKKIINAGLQRPTTDESDLELVSRTGSGLPSTGMSLNSTLTAPTRAGSWQETSPVTQESRSRTDSRNSPRPIPTSASSGSMQSSRARLEMDLAEAVATPSPGSVSPFASMPATAIGIHPGLESLASISGSRRRSSSASSRRLSGEERMQQDAATRKTNMVPGEGTKDASSSTGSPRSPDSAAESPSQFSSRSSSPTRSQSSSSPTSVTKPQLDISVSSTPSLPSPPHSVANREVPQQDSHDEVEERAGPGHHSFYALGIHGQTSTDSYAREIEESMSRTPPMESHRSSLTSVPSTNALEKSDSDSEGASGQITPGQAVDDDADDVDDDAIESVDAAATRPLAKEDSGSRETELGSDPESQDETSAPRTPSRKVLSPQDPYEGEQDDRAVSEGEGGSESENEKEIENGDELDRDIQESTSSSSFVTRPLSTASNSTLLTDDSFLSSLGGSSTTHERGLEDDGDEEERSHGGGGGGEDDDDEEEEEGESSPRSESSFALSGSDRQPMTREERKQEQQRIQRRKRRLLVDDAKRKQEQLDRIKAQLELKDLGKIRQQVSFWEEKGVLEQKVVAVVEVEEETEEAEQISSSSPKNEVSLSLSGTTHRGAEDLPEPGGQESAAQDKTVVIQEKIADITLAEPLSPGNGQVSSHDEPPKAAARRQGAPDPQAASVSSGKDLAVLLSDID